MEIAGDQVAGSKTRGVGRRSSLLLFVLPTSPSTEANLVGLWFQKGKMAVIRVTVISARGIPQTCGINISGTCFLVRISLDVGHVKICHGFELQKPSPSNSRECDSKNSGRP